MRYIINTCWNCGGQFDFEAKEIGREWKCPHCDERIVLRPRTLSSREATFWNAVKWVCILPGACLGFVMGWFLIGMAFSWWGISDPESTDPRYFQTIISSCFGAIGFVGASTMAPFHKHVVSIVLTVIYSILVTVVVCYFTFKHLVVVMQWTMILILCPSIAAAIWTCHIVGKENSEGDKDLKIS